MKDFIELTALRQEVDTTNESGMMAIHEDKVFVHPEKIMIIHPREEDKTTIVFENNFILDVKEAHDEIIQKIHEDEQMFELSPDDIKNKAYKEILSDEVVTTYIPVNTWRELQEKHKAYIL